jgi:hypothetical protein
MSQQSQPRIELHPVAEVRRQRESISTVFFNLEKTGLSMPGVEVAYRAALFGGATDEMAWEAARRYQLVQIGFPEDIKEQGGHSFPRAMSNVEGARKRRQAQIDACRALSNPFVPTAAHAFESEGHQERAA